MKNGMSSFDVMAVARELKELKGSHINKVFQISPSELRVQLNAPGRGRQDMAIVAGSRIHLTEQPKTAPMEATTFAMTLRKHLGNAVLEDVEQVSFDRILVLKCRRGELYHLIVELFGEGNVVLADENYEIVALLRIMRVRDRELLPKGKYALPPGRRNPFECSAGELVGIINNSGTDLVRTLARDLGLGGLYAEEVCLRSALVKDKKSITLEEAEAIRRILLGLRESLGREKPVIVYEAGKQIDVLPMMLEGYRGKDMKEFEAFNAALDEYFSRLEQTEVASEVGEEFKAEMEKLEARLNEQEALVEKHVKGERHYKEFGDFIYSRLGEIEGLLTGMAKAKEKYSWDELIEAFGRGDVEIPGAGLVSRILPKEGVVVLITDVGEMRLDVRKGAAANAEYFYTHGKKAREKMRGAEAAAGETRRLISELKTRGAKPVEAIARQARRAERKREWYEKFRWFTSSDGLLVLGGRDAASNEVLVKRHMKQGDVFVHADIHGAPAVVIKAEGKPVSDAIIQEAFDFAASYSKAWKHSVYGLDVYWVKPEQVSKTTEHGEYVGKGAFVVRGKKNIGKGVVQLAIGVKAGDEPRVLGGPPSAIEKQSVYAVRITPGRKSSTAIAAEIKSRLVEMAKEADREKILRLPLEEIQAFMPGGGCEVLGK